MRCLNCGARIPLTVTNQVYCDELCARAGHRPSEALPPCYRSTLQALLEDRPVSREDAAGFFGWLTRIAA